MSAIADMITPGVMQILYALVALICISGSAFLFIYNKRRRSRQWLAFAMALWALPYIWQTLTLLESGQMIVLDGILNPAALSAAVIYAMTLLLYPLMLVNPHFRVLRHAWWGLIPALAAMGLMWVSADLNPDRIADFASVLDDFWSFAVWPRVLCLLIPTIYLVWVFISVMRVERRWQFWRHANLEEAASDSTFWLVSYFVGVALIDAAYIWISLGGGEPAYFVHTVTVLLFFVFVAAKALATTRIYPTSFYRGITEGGFLVEDVDDAFALRIPAYARQIEQWFDVEKPFLNHGFQLRDVAAVVPLNRTYLARVFNEGLGCGFGELVRARRMAEARRLLREEPEMLISEIADRCGFAGHTSFHRSFMQMHGITPGEYRAENSADPQPKSD